ncbi:MAG: hypothetical protein CVV64_13845 [Candidatus Wallbacteria bacterium HGW-Wallbacteria-1]|uniref:Uncharacterized protein n=1 Tax=Candidatus Wallbacteria bacterium HGW-Wallbacteria-1 TaxID=2013854 RepID=A0A2N1PMC1_9BACT|nr:MAG: hypothetical protein CVV64_13845 [Candidatus Wallbacteria bacterium HGW-Wallbacteria-1]
MFIFFLSSVIAGMALGFIGFQLVAACDKLGFAAIDLYGIIMMAFSGPILISSVNLITGGRESSKVLATGLASFFLFSFMHPRCAHTVLGAAGMMNPLLTIVNMAFIFVIFVTAAMLIWNFSRGRIMAASPKPLGAALVILAICGISFGVWRQMKGQRVSWYQGFVEQNASAGKTPLKNIASAAMCSMPLGLPQGPEPVAKVWKGLAAEFDSMAQAGIQSALFRCYLPLDGTSERNWNQDERVIAMARQRGLSIILQDSVASLHVNGTSLEITPLSGITLETFISERSRSTAMVASRLKPEYYVIMGEPGFYYLSGVTGEFTPQAWIAGAQRVAVEVKKVSPITRCGISMNVMDLFGDRLSAAAGALLSSASDEAIMAGKKIMTGEAAITDDTEAAASSVEGKMKLLQSDLVRVMASMDQSATDLLDFVGMRVYFREQAERLELLLGDNLLPLNQGPSLWVIETWNGWALAPPRSPEMDSAWVRGISGAVSRAGFRGIVFSPFGNFREGIYYGDFQDDMASRRLSMPFRTIAELRGVSIEAANAGEAADTAAAEGK